MKTEGSDDFEWISPWLFALVRHASVMHDFSNAYPCVRSARDLSYCGNRQKFEIKKDLSFVRMKSSAVKDTVKTLNGVK